MTDQDIAESNLPEFYALFENTRKYIGQLGKNSHMGGKEMMINYVLPLFAHLHDDLNGALEDLAEQVADDGGVDGESADLARDAIIALAAFAEKALILGGLIVREETPEGPRIGKTDRTPEGLVEEFAALSITVGAALEALAEPDEDDEDDEDEDEDEDESPDLDQEDGTPGARAAVAPDEVQPAAAAAPEKE